MWNKNLPRPPSVAKKSGFTLTEILVALFLVTVGIGGVFALVRRTMEFTSVSKDQLVASYLAQEGIEKVRNTRDGNWLEGRSTTTPWDDGFSELEGSTSVIFLDKTQSKFTRTTTIEEPPQEPDIREVKVTVKWKERGRSHSVSSQENLYKWR